MIYCWTKCLQTNETNSQMKSKASLFLNLLTGVDKMALSHEDFSAYIFPPLFILTVLVTIESEQLID